MLASLKCKLMEVNIHLQQNCLEISDSLFYGSTRAEYAEFMFLLYYGAPFVHETVFFKGLQL